MAIQLPDVGTGVPADKTGDSPWLAMKKVRENFNDQTNAASRLVGTGKGNLLEAGVNGIGGAWDRRTEPNREKPVTLMGTGLSLSLDGGDAASPFSNPAIYSSLNIFPFNSSNGSPAFHRIMMRDSRVYVQQTASDLQSWRGASEFYTTGNTTKDSNGFLKAASPIVKVFADKVELNADAESQNVTYKKNGIGDYTITTVSGLSTDGWYIELPKDMNGNPKVAVTLSEVDGVISLKTYKRIFSKETLTFEPDLDNPLDIPDGRWIDLRLNEIPVEIEDDIQVEV